MSLKAAWYRNKSGITGQSLRAAGRIALFPTPGEQRKKDRMVFANSSRVFCLFWYTTKPVTRFFIYFLTRACLPIKNWKKPKPNCSAQTLPLKWQPEWKQLKKLKTKSGWLHKRKIIKEKGVPSAEEKKAFQLSSCQVRTRPSSCSSPVPLTLSTGDERGHILSTSML